MKTCLLPFFLLFCLQATQAQKSFAVQHEGSATFFSTLPDAYNAAVSGDTLYLPAGNFGDLSLEKSLAIIGVGHNPDSTSATGRTTLGNLALYDQADGSFITGLNILNTIQSYGAVANVTISRCFVGAGMKFNPGAITNWLIYENYIGQSCYQFGCAVYYSFFFLGNPPTNILVFNNVVQTHTGTFDQSQISNNIFLSGNISATGSQIMNNVFPVGAVVATYNCEWLNNINNGINGNDGNGNIGSGNYLDNVPLETVFVNYSTSNNFYQNDFHLINPVYNTGGTNGTTIGLYGGAFPWKAGSVPFNPHINLKVIGNSLNSSGNLPVQIRVAAQDH